MQQSAGSAELCPRETHVLIDVVKNTGANPREFAITSQGSAASWTVTTPQGFLLNPGEEKAVYTYVTPPSAAQPGNYVLELVISGGSETQRVTHAITLKSCFNVQIASPAVVQNACPQQVVKYEFMIKNTGAYQEDFTIRADGLLKNAVTLSDTIVSLPQGAQKQVDAYLIAPGDAAEYGFSVVVAGKSGKSVQALNAVLNVQPCYAFDVRPARQAYSLCEQSSETVPVEIENKGTATNNYAVTVKGPAWVQVDKTSLALLAGQKGVINLVLAPQYGVRENTKVSVEVTPERGSVKAVTDIDVEVRKCHGADVQMLQQDAQICADSVVRRYDFLMKNDGEVAKQYNMVLESPSWVAMTAPNLLSLQPGEQQLFQLVTQPGQEVSAQQYTAVVRAQATDASGSVAQDEDTLRLNVAAVGTCYAPKVSTRYNNVVVYNDASVTLPVSIQNTGSETATYDVVVSGAGVNFVKLNPTSMTIAPGRTETVFLYVAPGPQTALSSYDLEVGVKLRDSAILSATQMNIRVTDKPEEATRIDAVVLPGMRNWWGRMKGWLYQNFVPQQKVDSEVPQEEIQAPAVESAPVQENVEAIEVDAAPGISLTMIKGWLLDAWNGMVAGIINLRYYLLGAIVAVLVLLVLARLGFWENATDFFLEEDAPKKKSKKGQEE